jgi:hypothetical protein
MNSIDKRSRIKHAINTVCTYKAGSADQNAVTSVYSTHAYHYCDWPQ